MSNSISKRIYFILLSLIIVFFDQFTKHIISANYESLVNKELIFFSLDYVKNYGAAFNLFSGSRIFLSIVSLIIALALLYIILKRKNITYIDLLSYCLILGGSIGNGIDRISKGFVIDFISLNFISFPVFNVADISINIGVIIIIYGFFKYRR